ncbi:MAG: Zn-dependent oligopeptidase, partial [Patescibacteria group bacterium]|nr:Zn-dependent oligopeptidase [Patescibacteria group bacterium]
MKIIPKTEKDFEWIKFTPKQINEYCKKTLKKIDEDVEAIKSIPKEKRNFENTINAIEEIGEISIEDNPVSFLQYVSENETVR